MTTKRPVIKTDGNHVRVGMGTPGMCGSLPDLTREEMTELRDAMTEYLETGQDIDRRGEDTGAHLKWIVWSHDDRTGAWLQVNEGLRQDAETYAERCNAAAVKHSIKDRYVACPEGTDPA